MQERRSKRKVYGDSPLSAKIRLSRIAIEDFYSQTNGRCFVSYSGGKDSIVLLHLVRSLYPNIAAWYFDTGMEFPSVYDQINSTSGCYVARSKYTYQEVFSKYGYTVVSRQVSAYIEEVRKTRSNYLKWRRLNKSEKYYNLPRRWHYLIHAPFRTTRYCCEYLKREPANRIIRKLRIYPYMGYRGLENELRNNQMRMESINKYSGKNPVSTPLIHWSEQNIWDYIRIHGLGYPSIYDKGMASTSCMYCLIGIHLDAYPNRMQRLKMLFPEKWEYCMEKLGFRAVLKYLRIKEE